MTMALYPTLVSHGMPEGLSLDAQEEWLGRTLCEARTIKRNSRANVRLMQIEINQLQQAVERAAKAKGE